VHISSKLILINQLESSYYKQAKKEEN